MKITKTRKTEIMIINLYKCGTKKDHDADYCLAKNIMNLILLCFQLISIFTGTDHMRIVQKLYFSEKNILSAGIQCMQGVVYVQERTLLLYRRKYCEVIDALFVLIENFEFANLS